MNAAKKGRMKEKKNTGKRRKCIFHNILKRVHLKGLLELYGADIIRTTTK